MADSAIRRKLIAEVARILEESPFSRVGNSFLDLSSPEVLKRMEIEGYRWNTAFEKKFQIILSIDLCRPGTRKTSVRRSADHCFPVFRKNAGYLWGKETFLYVLRPPFRLEQPASELRHDIGHYMLPFFEKCDSIDGVIRTLREENKKLGRNFFSAALAVALARLGRVGESREFFLESMGDPEMIRKAARAYGINLDA